MTDHSIPRGDKQADVQKAGRSSGRWINNSATGGRQFLVPFHRDEMTVAERDEARREVAIAYSREGAVAAATALRWLEATLAVDPRDVVAWQAKGVALGWLNRREDALNAFQVALKMDPKREFLLKEAAQGAELAGATEIAGDYWQQAISVNPWRSDYRAALARLYVQKQDWTSAVRACREVIRLNPANAEVRRWLVQSYKNLGDHGAAEAEQTILNGFDTIARSLPSH
jgi:tetratricopeptide (TPR) repeat protein